MSLLAIAPSLKALRHYWLFSGREDTYVADVKRAGASPVKFDEYFLRWDALMEVDNCDVNDSCRTS